MTKALVTGAGKRLGRAMALCLADAGFDVAIHYATSEQDAAAVVDEIKARGRKAVPLQADLLNEAEIEGLVARASAGLGGPLTVLINNASIFEYDRLESATRDSWDRHMGSNLRAPFVLTQTFAAEAEKARQDDKGEAIARNLVVNMIDQRVRKLTPEFMTYTLAKMGLWAFTQTAAQALAPHVRVNCIAAHLIETPMTAGHFKNRLAIQAIENQTPLGRMGHVDDIANAALFLASSESGYISGETIRVDGGAFTQKLPTALDYELLAQARPDLLA